MRRKIFLLISAIVLALATYILGYSTFFTVSGVEVIGSRTTLNPGVVPGQKLARVEPHVIAAKFETLNWVKSAKVSRNWISGKVTIKLVERTPAAIFNNQIIDAAGKSFVLQGPAPPHLVQIQAGGIAAAVKAVEFIAVLPADLKRSLKILKVRSTNALVLIVEDGQRKLEIRWGTNTENELKLKVYQALIALSENATIERIDVSAPHAPIVK